MEGRMTKRGRHGRSLGRVALFLVVTCGPVCAADNPRALLGTWIGKASGPQGAPPTGDLTVTFKAQGSEIGGRMVVKGQGGNEYSGDVSGVSLRKGIFSGTATLKLGENPLTVEVSGPLKGKMIEGTFTVTLKGQKMGDGTFSIKKVQSPKLVR
jgi:hypothetical protein